MNIKTFSTYINATTFFRDFCPDVTNWKNKMRGKNGRGNPIEFTADDMRMIKTSIAALKTAISRPD